jgi:hypothetical protein
LARDRHAAGFLFQIHRVFQITVVRVPQPPGAVVTACDLRKEDKKRASKEEKRTVGTQRRHWGGTLKISLKIRHWRGDIGDIGDIED